jgi:carboxypeptidase Taq
LFDGVITIADLPEAWDAAYRTLVGVTGTDFATGWGQDIHFASGAFGYFGSYTVGNAAAAQIFAAADAELALDDAFAAGEYSTLFGWLKANVWDHGARYPTPELIERATGSPLGPDALVAHLRAIATEVVGA